MDLRKKFDYAVVGAGLTGTIIAKGLSRQGAKVLLLEATESPSPVSGLNPASQSADAQKHINFFQVATGLPVQSEVHEILPKTFDSGSVKDFLGFGDTAPEYVDVLTAFLNTSRFGLTPSPETWVNRILEDFTGDLQVKSYVTGFEFEGDKIKTLVLNGQSKASADQIIFAGSLPQLTKLVPVEHWNAKALSKFSKMKSWTAIGLDLQHSKNEASFLSQEVWTLKGTPQDASFPCVGVFSADGKSSQWMTWIKDTDAEDTEEVAAGLKRIKRQIKQAFPELMSHIDFERIYVQPSWSITAPGGEIFPEIENLHVASAALAHQPGFFGSLEQATSCLQSMGFTEASFPELQIPNSESSEFQIADSKPEMVDAPL